MDQGHFSYDLVCDIFADSDTEFQYVEIYTVHFFPHHPGCDYRTGHTVYFMKSNIYF